MHQKSREDHDNDEVDGVAPAGGSGGPRGAGGGVCAAGSASAVARSRRLRAKNEPCALPDRLLHRVSRVTQARSMMSSVQLHFDAQNTSKSTGTSRIDLSDLPGPNPVKPAPIQSWLRALSWSMSP